MQAVVNVQYVMEKARSIAANRFRFCIRSISEKIGVHQNSLINWSRDLDKRLAPPYEMLIRLLAGEAFGIEIDGGIDSLKAAESYHPIEIIAA